MDPNTGMVTQWGVFDPRRQTPVTTASDQVSAEEFAQRNMAHTILPSMVLPQSGIDTINMGMPSYSREAGVSHSEGAEMAPMQPGNARTVSAGAPLVGALNSLVKKLRLGIKVTVKLHDKTIEYQQKNPQTGQKETVRKPGNLGLVRYQGKSTDNLTGGEIHVSVGMHVSAEALWATMVHEVGHLVMYTTFRNVSDKVRTAIFAAHDKFYQATHPDITMEELLQMQSNAAFLIDRVLSGQQSTVNISQLTPEKQAYWRSFEEWFAEQTAKWATTSEPALSHVEKFFKGMADVLRLILESASKMFGMRFEPVPEMKALLDSFFESDIGKLMGPQIATATTQSTTVKNNTQMAPEDTAVAAQPETAAGNDGVNGVFNGRPPKEAQQAKAYADKFNWMWKKFTGIHQLAAANRHIRALAEYVDTVRAAQQVKQQIKIRSDEVLRKWNRLGETQADAVSKLLDDVQYMTYLSDDEKKAKA